MDGEQQVDEREQALIAARAVVASCLVDAAQSARLLEGVLRELEGANRDLQRAGGYPRVGAGPLLSAVKSALSMWAGCEEGRAALGLPPLPTHREQVLQSARADVRALEAQLERARAVVANEYSVDGKRRNIESLSVALVRSKRRLSELEGGSSIDAFKRWLREFSADIQRALREAPLVQRGGGDTLRRLEERDAAEAWRENPLAAVVAAELERE